MRNRRKAVVVLLAVLLVAGVAYWTSPRVLFDDADSLQIYRITAAGAAGESRDITDAVDIAVLQQGLQGLDYGRVPVFMEHYALADVRYEVDGHYQGESFHIIVGRINYVYGGAGQGYYELRGGEELVELLDRLTGSSE